MTDDEIRQALRNLSLDMRGRIDALTNIIHALQAQPGYDHEAFQTVLAGFQVRIEKEEGNPPEAFRKGYRDTLAAFALDPIRVPSKLRDRMKPPKE